MVWCGVVWTELWTELTSASRYFIAVGIESAVAIRAVYAHGVACRDCPFPRCLPTEPQPPHHRSGLPVPGRRMRPRWVR